MPPTLPGFDHTRYTWVQTAPGKWTVEEKVPEPHPFANYGPSIRDLVGGDLDLTMGGGVHFHPGDVSPREEPPRYGGKFFIASNPLVSFNILNLQETRLAPTVRRISPWPGTSLRVRVPRNRTTANFSGPRCAPSISA